MVTHTHTIQQTWEGCEVVNLFLRTFLPNHSPSNFCVTPTPWLSVTLMGMEKVLSSVGAFFIFRRAEDPVGSAAMTGDKGQTVHYLMVLLHITVWP